MVGCLLVGIYLLLFMIVMLVWLVFWILLCADCYGAEVACFRLLDA